VPEPSTCEVEVAIGKLKWYKSPGADHIPAELIPGFGGTLHAEIHKLTRAIPKSTSDWLVKKSQK
jgi:hypothetical protein